MVEFAIVEYVDLFGERERGRIEEKSAFHTVKVTEAAVGRPKQAERCGACSDGEIRRA
jgi:hypothetical protein